MPNRNLRTPLIPMYSRPATTYPQWGCRAVLHMPRFRSHFQLPFPETSYTGMGCSWCVKKSARDPSFLQATWGHVGWGAHSEYAGETQRTLSLNFFVLLIAPVHLFSVVDTQLSVTFVNLIQKKLSLKYIEKSLKRGEPGGGKVSW